MANKGGFIQQPMIYPETELSEITTHGAAAASCLRQHIGSCRGCNVVDIAMGEIRWKGQTLEKATDFVRKRYCPKGEHPDISVGVNKEASFTMGTDHRGENLEGLTAIGRFGYMVRGGRQT